MYLQNLRSGTSLNLIVPVKWKTKDKGSTSTLDPKVADIIVPLK